MDSASVPAAAAAATPLLLAPAGVSAPVSSSAPASSEAAASAPAPAGACVITNENDAVTLPVKAAGWGFEDTELRLNKAGQVELSGSRYLFSGKELPSLRSWMEKNASLNIDWHSPTKPQPPSPAPIKNEGFIAALQVRPIQETKTYYNQSLWLHSLAVL